MNTRLSMFLVGAALLGSGSTAQAEDILIRGGYVMTMDAGVGDLENTDVLIRNGRIAGIGKGLNASDATIVDAREAIVLPGFVDTHSHLYTTTMRGQFRNGDGQFFPVSSKAAAKMTPEGVETAMHLGAVELIQAGITTTADFFDNVSSPAHGEAGLRALQRSGIRGTLYYGGPDRSTKHPINLDQLRMLVARQKDDAQIGIDLAWRLPRDLEDARNWAMRQREFDTARELEIPVQVHVSGEPGPMFDALIERGYLFSSLTAVHATDASAAQLQALESAGARLALTPISEQRVGLGKRADLQIIRLDSLNLAGFGGGDPSALLVYSARPSDIDTVLVSGKILKRNGQMVDAGLPQLLQAAKASSRAIRGEAMPCSWRLQNDRRSTIAPGLLPAFAPPHVQPSS